MPDNSFDVVVIARVRPDTRVQSARRRTATWFLV